MFFDIEAGQSKGSGENEEKGDKNSVTGVSLEENKKVENGRCYAEGDQIRQGIQFGAEF